MQAIILTGKTTPDHDPEAVWNAAAKFFRLDAEAFRGRVLSRCPLTIRETENEAEAQRIVETLGSCGAEIESIASDGSKWSVQRSGLTCGPVPLTYLKYEHEAGRISGATRVKQSADTQWISLVDALGQSDLILDIPPDVSPSSTSPSSQRVSPKSAGAAAALPTTQSPPKESTGKTLLKGAGWLALLVLLYGGERYVNLSDTNTNRFHGHVKLISLGLEFVSCESDGPAYKCVVRARQPMDVREECAYFDSQGRIIGSPKNVSDLSGVNFSAHETRVVTVYAFDKEVTTIECNYVPEAYKYDALMKGLPDLKKAGVAWEIDI